MPFFSPFGYGYRFDALANSLTALFGVADETQSESVDAYIDENLVDGDQCLLPAFWPVITPKDEYWDDLQTTFSHRFKNEPWEYHNGGRWPLVTGFHVAALAARGKHDRARRFLRSLHEANHLSRDGEPWSFPEFIHGKDGTPGGTSPMGWSAAAAVIGEKALEGSHILSTLEGSGKA